MTQPTLDLFSQKPHALHSPRLAAIAMLLFAATYALLTLDTAFSMILSMLTIGSAFVRDAINGVAASFEISGLILLGIANLARRRINPWPRLITLIAGLASDATALALFVLSLLHPMLLPRPVEIPIAIFFFVTSLAAYIAALLYALQIARLLRRRSLAIASLIALGGMILCTLASILSWLHWFIEPLRILWETSSIDVIVNTYSVLAMFALTLYFLILAARLFRLRPAT
jgi:hypothetical protein